VREEKKASTLHLKNSSWGDVVGSRKGRDVNKKWEKEGIKNKKFLSTTTLKGDLPDEELKGEKLKRRDKPSDD